MKNILTKPDYSSKYGLNGFDLSHFFRFSAAPSELIPVLSDELYPNDRVELSCDTSEALTIIAMNSGSFARATGHIEYFFVPFKQLFAPFESFIYGVDDIHSSVYSRTSDDDASYKGALPYFSSRDLQLMYLNWLDNEQTAKNVFGVRKIDQLLKLLPHLGYGNPFYNNVHPVSPEWSDQQKLNPFRAAAYQKIWFDYYRLSDWTENDSTAYNLDLYANTVYTLNNHIPDKVLYKIFTLRYRPWDKDFYTNIFPEPLFGSESINALEDGFHLSEIQNWLASQSSSSLEIQNQDGNSYSPYTRVQNLDSLGSPVDVNLSFAVQKLLEKTRRAPKHYDQQTLAHYGIKPESQRDGSVIFLGSHEFNIDVKDVVSTAETSDASIGAIGGRGYGAAGSQKPIHFKAESHGILMAIFSIEPYADYMAIGLDKQNTYSSRFDYFIPELDNMGMIPQFRYQARFIPANLSENSRILGWTYAFAESKMKYDKVAGNLMYSARSWIPTRNDENVTDVSHENKLYIDPSYFDDLFELKYLASERPIGSFVTDPFEVSLHFDYKKLSTMSTYSLLKL